MNKEVPYWNPYQETLPPEELEKLQLKKFRRIVRWAYEKSRFHRALYEEAGLEPDDIRSMEDVRRVPKVEKSMMRTIQRKDPSRMGMLFAFRWTKSRNFVRPAARPATPFISRTHGEIGSGGPNAGRLCYGRRAIDRMTVFSFLSVTIYL